MRDQLEAFYEQELYAIRHLAREFARERPKIAGRLDLDLESGISDDPHVERLIESFAFLTARIRLKLEDEFPELTEALLSVLYPHYLAPIPSMSIVQFELDAEQGQAADGYVIPRHSRLYTREVNGTPCRFRTGYPVTLWPIQLSSGRYQVAPFGEDILLPPGSQQTEALIRLELQALAGMTFADLNLRRLRFFLSGDDRTVHQLYELLFSGVARVAVRPVGGGKAATVILPPECLLPVGFETDEGLLPYGSQSFVGYRLLTEYFAFPSKFLFVDIEGLHEVCRPGAGNRLEILLLLNEADSELESRIDVNTFRLGCCPAVNLFTQKADPIRLTHTKTEYMVLPDVRHTRAMEVYSVDAVESINAERGGQVEYRPFFSYRHGLEADRTDAYWYTRRTPSVRADDSGTDVYLALVNLGFDPILPAADELFVTTTCTNRDLPGELRHAKGERWGFQMEGQGPIRSIQPVVAPTPTLRLPAGEQRWRLISHLALNHLSITDGETGGEALREILKLYDFSGTRVTSQQIAGLISVSSRRKTLRIADGLRSGFCRGIEVNIELDPDKYTGGGLYLFASVVERFLGLYASLNSFTRTITRLKGRSEVHRQWPHRIGQRTLI